MGPRIKLQITTAVAVIISVSASSSYEMAFASQLSHRNSAVFDRKPFDQTAPNKTNPGLPNSKATPGAIDPSVTQENLASTICVSGYTKTVRPPASYTTKLKKQQLASGYNYLGDLSTKSYEEDHLIPLEIGGAPRDVRNLWPEPRHIIWDAAKKDQLENKLHLLLCSRQITLKVAQLAFSINWVDSYRKYIGGN